MYEIFLNDSALLYSTSRVELQRGVIVKGLKLELNKAGSLSFVLHSTHPNYDSFQPMKSVVTVKDDDVEIFRGRASRYTTSFYNERSVECEGDLAYLNDSLMAPNRTIGSESSSNDGITETVEAFFRRCIAAHNSQVEAWKRFTVGNITISQKSKKDTFKLNGYNTVLNVIESELLKYYGGFLRTRRVGNTSYIDYIESYNESTSQPIQFSVNLLDLTENNDTDDLYTILVPTGKDDLTIASVNNNSKELVNQTLVNKYGRIYRPENFSDIESASELKTAAQEKMSRDILAFYPSYSCKALDLHLMYPSLGKLLIGRTVHVTSYPQGIDLTDTILSAQIDIQNPENSTYEIGKYSSDLQRRSKDLSSKQSSDSKSASDKAAADAKDKAATASTITNVKYELNRHGEEIEDNAHHISLIASDADLAEIESGTISSMYQWSKLELTATKSELSTNVKLTGDMSQSLINAGVFNSVTPVKDESGKVVDYEVSSNLMVKKEVYDTTADGLEKVKSGLLTAGVFTSIDAQGNAKANLVTKKEIFDGAVSKLVEAGVYTGVDAAGNPTSVMKVVGKDGVITAINASTEGVTIQAKKVDLGAYATVSSLEANYVKSNWFQSNTLVVGGLRVTGGATFAGVTCNGNISATSGTITGSSIVTSGGINLDKHRHSISADSDGTVTIGEATSSSSSASFNIADTSYYKNHVGCRAIGAGTASLVSGEYGYDYSIPITAYAKDNSTYESTVTISANAAVKQGYYDYYHATSKWKKPSADNDWTCMIPNESNSGSEEWFTVASILPTPTFTWSNPAKGYAKVDFYLCGKYYVTSYKIPSGWM